MALRMPVLPSVGSATTGEAPAGRHHGLGGAVGRAMSRARTHSRRGGLLTLLVASARRGGADGRRRSRGGRWRRPGGIALSRDDCRRRPSAPGRRSRSRARPARRERPRAAPGRLAIAAFGGSVAFVGAPIVLVAFTRRGHRATPQARPRRSAKHRALARACRGVRPGIRWVWCPRRGASPRWPMRSSACDARRCGRSQPWRP